jgi:hypothetical protein
VTHLVIHHTATTNNATDWPYWVRAIWEYHANTLGWGDIGYNYLVDPNGVIYEGRAGGDDVAAAHTGMFNAGSLGVGIIGDFHTTNATPTTAAINSVQRLLAWKCTQREIDPQASAWIRARRGSWGCNDISVLAPCIAGHRDYAGYACPGSSWDPNNTSCPGQYLYPMLPSIRSGVASLIPRYSVGVSNVTIAPSLVAVGGLLRMTITVTNTGNVTLKRGYPDAGLGGCIYEEGETAPAGAFDTFRVGLDFSERDPGQGAYPYRWGLGADLPPGESRTIDCYVRIRRESQQSYWSGAVREQFGLVADRLYVTQVQARIKHGDLCIANVALRPSIVFRGNVLEVYAEVENWTDRTLPTQGPNPNYVYTEGETCPADVAGAFRIGVDYDGRSGKDYPYRWGLGSSVPPLTVRAFRAFITLTTNRPPRDYWVGFVEEGVRWHQSNLARTAIRVQDAVGRVVLPSVER